MKEAINVPPYELVTNTQTYKTAYMKYHKAIVGDKPRKHLFEAMIPEIVSPNFVMLYGNTSEGMAVNEIIRYVEHLIPTIEQTKTEIVKDDAGEPVKDEDGKPMRVPVKGDDGEYVRVKVPLFTMAKSSYQKIQQLVGQRFSTMSTYWDARRFVERNTPTIDEEMFDKMNDYLWRHIMAVVYPEDVKREFKHMCVNVKRKLFYLGDRNKVFNQTVFGLYDYDKGGTGKTTLLQAFAQAFSNDNPLVCRKLEDLFGFNSRSADKFGVCFIDENSRGAKANVKDAVKAFVDADSRTVEFKGVDAFDVPHLFTMVVSANHKISSRLFEDEARGQRRDACFEVIGLLHQYSQKDMLTWFNRMFAVCPMDDDSRTYKHRNPHSNELTSGEIAVLNKLIDTSLPTPPRGKGWQLSELRELLELPSGSDEWFRLRTLLETEYFTKFVGGGRMKFYRPNMNVILQRMAGGISKAKDVWSRDWRDARPYVDVNATIAKLEKDALYDCSAPIDYDQYFATGK